MATLGSSTTGFGFSVSGSYGDIAGGAYTVPSPGIYITGIHCYYGNNGSSSTGRLYVWQDSGGQAGVWLVRSGTFPLGSLGWQAQTSGLSSSSHLSSDGYIPAGTVIWIGAYSSSGIENMQGASTGTTDLGNTADGDFVYHSVASGGMGVLAAYVDYSPLAAPTISSISPSVAAPGSSITITGTSFNHVSSVTIGGVSASFTINSDTQITATVPNVGGVVTVTVTNPAGSGSSTMTAGQIYYGTGSAVASIVAVWYGDSSGVPHKVAGVWVPSGTGVKRIW